ncbi:MAG: molybdopterin dinucleotide binding domain-containing protein [Gammaproteobacteria bacterium]
MAETMILVPGRSQSQRTSLNEGKLKDEYKKVTSTAELNEKDMRRLKLKDGDKIKLKSDVGQTVVSCKSKKDADLPAGMIFIPYGPPSSELMASDTAGTGMPLSKHMEVKITKVK